MKHLRKRMGFTLIELLVVILILAILMAIALPLYLRAVRNSNRQTCRSNMQTIGNAAQAYRIRSAGHSYPADVLVLTAPDPVTGLADLQSVPECPTDDTGDDNNDYVLTLTDADTDGVVDGLTIECAAAGASADTLFHNTDSNGVSGFQVGIDSD